jgi:hypothetical protein
MATTRTDAAPNPDAAPGPVKEAPVNPKKIARQRRKDSLGRIWRQYRKSFMGMAGLGILLFFVVIAVFAPLLADKCDLSPICHPNNPSLSPPTAQFWFGTDFQGRSVLSLTIWGARVSLIVGLAATLITVVIGTAGPVKALASFTRSSPGWEPGTTGGPTRPSTPSMVSFLSPVYVSVFVTVALYVVTVG